MTHICPDCREKPAQFRTAFFEQGGHSAARPVHSSGAAFKGRPPGARCYFATFAVCLLLGSPVAFMASALATHLLSLTSRIHRIPDAAFMVWAVVAIAFQIAGFVQTARYRVGPQGRHVQSSCDGCGCFFSPWFEKICQTSRMRETHFSEARMGSC
jgi:hypothetical protein